MTETHARIETVFRMERARLIAGLTRLVRDVSQAEDLAQDALVAALDSWPRTGVPDNPAGWLMTAARRRAIDGFRHRDMQRRRRTDLVRALEPAGPDPVDAADAALDDAYGDELLALIFTACHPCLSREARVALTLRVVAGLGTAEIARAFMAREATIAQRIVRAKKTLAAAAPAFSVPRGPDRAARMGSVLEVIYLIFNEGYAATSGTEAMRPTLCAEAQRLGRILAALAPDDAEALGLLALMELHASRLAARRSPGGLPVPLPEQDRRRWDRLLIRHGLAALARADRLAGGSPGPYLIQARIAACHARAAASGETDWARIAGLYAALHHLSPSPVVALNHAIACSMAFGPQAGLDRLDDIPAASLPGYAPLPAARGDMLQRAGQAGAARAAFEQAAAMSTNEAERRFLLGRAAACGPAPAR